MVETNRPEAMVEFDYIAQEPDELTIRKGDIIKDIKTQPGGWWEGKLGDKRGMFPDNFVRILAEVSKKEAPPVSLRTMSGRKCRVLFSYQPVNEDELQLEVNDIIDILGEVEEGWWKGKLRDGIGVFPSNFVTEISDSLDEGSNVQASSSDIKSRNSLLVNENADSTVQCSEPSLDVKNSEDSDAPVLPPKPVKELCRVLFPYEAANEDELTLKEGDVISLLSKEVADKGWWKGELRGRVGVFPDNFVEIIPQEEISKKPERPPSKSQLCTTNRIRDTITKPTPNISRSDHTEVAATRKPQGGADITPLISECRQPISSEDENTTPPDDRPSFPPVPGKKPQLPPPVKKPQRIVMGNSHTSKHQDSSEQVFPDIVDGVGSSRIAPSNYSVPKSSSREEVPEFDSVERSAMLNHPTASRVKAPRRRLPTTMHSRENDTPPGLMNGNQEEEDMIKPNGPQARLWENKSKAPWMEELKMNQAKKPKTTGALKSSPTANTSHTSGVLDHGGTRDPPHHGLGRHSLGAETNIPTTAEFPSKPSLLGGSTKQINEKQPSKEMSSGLPNKPHSLSTPSLHGVEESRSSDVNQNHQNFKSHFKQSPSPSSEIPTKTESSSASGGGPQLGSHGPHHPGPGIPSVQYLELMEKIVKLERNVEQQRAMFTQAIKEITEKLNEERNRRTHLEQELDKLTNLVTQV